ncbi:MAG: hypothetical protein AAGA85_07260 [Bacteroidota bacterium]
MRKIRISGWKRGTTDIRKVFAGEEIVLKDLIAVFWDRRLMVIAIVLLFWVIAIAKIATTPYSYTCTSTYITESSAQSTDLQGGVAELFGLSGANSGGRSGTFSDPGFYPAIVGSQPFLANLMEEEFYFANYGEQLTLQQFALQYDGRNLVNKLLGPVFSIPRRMIASFEKKPEEVSQSALESIAAADTATVVSPILTLSRAEINAMDNVGDRINISALGNLIEVETKMPDPVVCAKLNQLVSESLLDFIITRETEKERRDLAFVERRVETARLNFEKVQRALARFRDSNRGVVSAEAQTREERLQSEYSIYFGIFQRLATELEEKKIALEEKTPIFSVFEPVFVPRDPDSRGSFRTLILYTIMGVFFGGLVVTGLVVLTLIRTS